MKLRTLLSELFLIAGLPTLVSCSAPASAALQPIVGIARPIQASATLSESAETSPTPHPTPQPPSWEIDPVFPDVVITRGGYYRFTDASGKKMHGIHYDDGGRLFGSIDITVPLQVSAYEKFPMKFKLDSRNSLIPNAFATLVLYTDFNSVARKTDCVSVSEVGGVRVTEAEFPVRLGYTNGVMLKPSGCDYMNGGTAVNVGNRLIERELVLNAPGKTGSYRMRILMQTGDGIAWPFTGTYYMEGPAPVNVVNMETRRMPEYGSAGRTTFFQHGGSLLGGVPAFELSLFVR